MEKIKWYEHAYSENEKPHQWYYHGDPCALVAVGVMEGKKTPSACRIQTADGDIRELWWEGGILPGVTYEVGS